MKKLVALLPLVCPLVFMCFCAISILACSTNSSADSKPACSISDKTCATALISDFESCVAAGNKVLKTYPGRCISADGKVFVQQTRAGRATEPVIVPTEIAPLKKLCNDTCGNGKCEEIVCMGSGCPCAETAESCPQDCK